MLVLWQSRGNCILLILFYICLCPCLYFSCMCSLWASQQTFHLHVLSCAIPFHMHVTLLVYCAMPFSTRAPLTDQLHVHCATSFHIHSWTTMHRTFSNHATPHALFCPRVALRWLYALTGGTGEGRGGGPWGQLPPQSIRCGGYAPTIAHSHDSDTASPDTVYSQIDTTAAR